MSEVSKVPLPYPWEYRLSKTKHRFYYFNPETKISQWKIPSPSSGTKSVRKKCQKSDSKIVAGKKSEEKLTILSGNKKKKTWNKINSLSCIKKRKVDDDDDDDTEKNKLSLNKKSHQSKSSSQKTNSNENIINSKICSSVSLGAATDLKLNSQKSDDVFGLKMTWKKNFQKVPVGNRKLWDATPRVLTLRKSTASKKLEKTTEKKTELSKCQDFKTELNLTSEEKLNICNETLNLEEENMEVEYNEEIQMMFEQIQGVRNEMKKSESKQMTTEVQEMMDILTSSGENSSKGQELFLIIDTNLFLDDGNFLSSCKIKMCRHHFVYVIPWVVIQEIDHIKNDKRRAATNQGLCLQSKARMAVNLINTWLECNDRRVIGQNPRELPLVKGFTPENNDDKILECCLLFMEKYSVHQVALLTMDKNLRNKAMLLNITAFSKEGLSSWLKDTTRIDHDYRSWMINKNSSDEKMKTSSQDDYHSNQSFSNVTCFSTIPSCSSFSRNASSQLALNSCTRSSSLPTTTTSCVLFTPGKNNVTDVTCRFSMTLPSAARSSRQHNDSIEKIYQKKINGYAMKLKNLMFDGLSFILEAEMKSIYKNLWEDVVFRKKPWSLIDVLESIKKHWIAVFKNFWTREDQDLIQELILDFQTNNDSHSKLSHCMKKCHQLLIKMNFNNISDVCLIDQYKSLKNSLISEFMELDTSVQSLVDKKNQPDCPLGLQQISSSNESSILSSSQSDFSSSSSRPPSSQSHPHLSFSATSSLLSGSTIMADCDLISSKSHDDDDVFSTKVQNCFDVVLKRIIFLRDLHKQELFSTINQQNRDDMLQSYMQLCQYISIIHELYYKALSASGEESSDIYDQLSSTLSTFAHLSNIQLSPVTVQAFRNFFNNSTTREMAEVGLSQIHELKMTILQFKEFLTVSNLSLWNS